LEAACDSPRYGDCLEKWQGIAGYDLGALRALIGKASAQWNAEPAGGFRARFRRPDRVEGETAGVDPGLELYRLDLITPAGIVSMSRATGKTDFCTKDECLDEIHPRPPFSEFRRVSAAKDFEGREDHPMEAVFTPLQSPAFRAVLDGRIVDASPLTDSTIPNASPNASSGASLPAAWVKLYHGRNLFSRYRGFARLHAGLRPGSLIRAGDTLGYVSAGADSLGALGVRIEKDGLAVDPLAFLGLGADSAEGDR